ncbi:bifunctional [glutamine synthetase] adenylyltransferase/[glutamine synthetase]-adenylyl-L-tyrosine phosphorylase [Sphingosinicella ginsenosidimutans]|uniref:Bifunctional [glutamine synthetase] adenylyltransferase/[glutamine synthetase]-adenylyl-L-tyrosine phosphorylase n=1 Tax=Allosphingosinicella ginsenosidimutans TaxID=1176539 RepID=A0A5C6TQE8_9SPHN|nr:bifunctional [glutamine synthetase] adenylyltransferase/[glutamine synthetase]-adenylyl-L-tyrosine phosphorylase [Sphingosinicella ginsenosidimutans]TXC62677.1 bifunctional [glutamine synthetase] adenylyltransferase/[glutamine synthetase]-adenylyl-L-tyrosine phosphorylase [Sphingosinicella ginsenosidimutans]
MIETRTERDFAAALARARACSPFLALESERFPEVTARLEAGDLAGALAAAEDSSDDPARAVRRTRSAHALALGIADLAGAMSLEEVTAALSSLADRTLETAIAAAVAERTPGEAARGFAIIALGKLGGGELNYSSDVDLIFLFDPETLPRKPREEPIQAAVRLSNRIVELVQARTEDGYAFRVDLRLRPSPEVTPVALPVNAAISHYESSALPWERAAFIRARACAGDAALGRYFLEAIHPFVWRRSLDFGAIGEIQAMSHLIRDHYAGGQAFGPGFDLKRGRGGIREIEFFVQIHQLIHGGREPELRSPSTLAALAALQRADRIAPHVADSLAAAYRIERTIEHRLQMVDDRQTHALPRAGDALDNVARLHGLPDGAALLALLRPQVEAVSAFYDRLGGGEEARLPLDGEALTAALVKAGFADPAAARTRIEDWRSGKARSLRSPAARDAFEAMLPVLVEAFAGASDPNQAMNRFGDLIERLPSGINLFRLLVARPALTQQLGAILSHAPPLADQIGLRPALLDGLIDASAFDPPPDVPALAEEFARPDRDDEDYQLLLDRVRRRVNERRFALGAQLVTGAGDPIEVARGYARVAEAAIQALADAAIADFEARHGRVPGSELLILGLGRLGGSALTHASDLDLIYLFSGTHEAESDGPKPLRATDYFNRLAPRVTAALSVATAAGPLYEVDTRLRPSGADGMLAVSLDSFAAYQADRAWTFEHMALTRGRPVYGSPEGRAALAATVAGVLRAPHDPARVVADAVAMRAEMNAHKPPAGPFDIKLGPGGLVDLEFAIQVLQLTSGIGLTPRLGEAITDLAATGLAGPQIAPAMRLLTRILVMLRLVAPGADIPAPPSRALVARACGLDDWDALVAAHDRARADIAALWAGIARR